MNDHVSKDREKLLLNLCRSQKDSRVGSQLRHNLEGRRRPPSHRPSQTSLHARVIDEDHSVRTTVRHRTLKYIFSSYGPNPAAAI